MKNVSKVVTLEQARRLKSAGYPQDNSWFYWIKNDVCNPVYIPDFDKEYFLGSDDDPVGCNETYAAPTELELFNQIYKYFSSPFSKNEVIELLVDFFENKNKFNDGNNK